MKQKRKVLPQLKDIFEQSMQDTLKRDLNNDNSILELLEEENATFYIRVLNLFLVNASSYFTINEITRWLETTLLKESELPSIEEE